VNAYTMPAWQAAVSEYERAMRPVEAVVAGKLRTHISGAVDRPQQLLREFAKSVGCVCVGRPSDRASICVCVCVCVLLLLRRYKNLLARPTILRELVAERETLLAQLTAMVEAMDGEYETKAASAQSFGKAKASNGLGPVGGRNTSSVVLNVVWVQSVKSKVRALGHSSRGVFPSVGWCVPSACGHSEGGDQLVEGHSCLWGL
jgi:dynein heavy chain 2, cytosolic